MIELASRLERERRNNSANQPAISSVAIIGAAGQTGELFARTLAPIVRVEAVVRDRRWNDQDLHPEVRFHTSIGEMLRTKPEVVILATPNPVDKALKEIAQHTQKPFTLILSQNGTGVAERAEGILASAGSQITLIRASLFTNVSRDSEGRLIYNSRKKRIALATAGDGDCDSLQRAENMFTQAGFDVKTVPDYHAMEWTKLVINLLGSTSTVTGLPPETAFSDPKIFSLEHRGLKDRLRIVEADGKVDDSLWNIGKLKWAAWIPTFIALRFRRIFAKMVARERNNQLPAVARAIQEGRKALESTDFYHLAITRLGRKHGLESPVDEAIMDILKRHERSSDNFSLMSQDPDTKKRLLLEIFGLETKRLFVPSFLPIRFAANKCFDLATRTFEIKGKENLSDVQRILEQGQSVQIDPLHRSHSDHEALMRALQESLPKEVLKKYPVYILANTRFNQEIFSAILGYAYDHPLVQTIGEEDGKEARWRAQIINSRSARMMEELFKKPCIFVVYLEGSRSRNVQGEKVQLQEPAFGSSSWLLDTHFSLVIPTVIQGTEKILPPGENIPRRGDISVEFCKPIKTSDLRAQGSTVSRLQRSNRYLSRIVLSKIAEKLPNDERGPFRTETSTS